MKSCEICGKKIDYGEGYRWYGRLLCGECAVRESKRAAGISVEQNINKDGIIQNSEETVYINQNYTNNTEVKNNWANIIKSVCYVMLVIGILASLAGGIAAGFAIGDFLGIVIGLAIVLVGILLSVISQSVTMTFATMANDIASIKASLLIQNNNRQ